MTYAVIITWILAFFRVSSFLFSLTFLKGGYIPNTTKVVLSFSISIMASRYLSAATVTDTFTLFQMAIIQLLIGFTLGYIVNTVISVASSAGSLFDYDTGLSMAQMVSPDGTESTAISNLYYILFMVIFIDIGGFRTVIESIVYSFKLTHLTYFLDKPQFMDALLSTIMYMLASTMQIALPFMATMFLVNLFILILGRATPQINVFQGMFAIKIMLGFAFLIVFAPILGDLFQQLDNGLNDNLLSMMKVMNGE
jgi:flagellar biosynthesis protein FliR